MTGPVNVDCPDGVWTLVASSVVSGQLWKVAPGTHYRQTWRDTGDAAPTDPEEGAFFGDEYVPISAPFPGIDVYIWCHQKPGRVMVDNSENVIGPDALGKDGLSLFADISLVNSSTTPLGVGGVFTGIAEEVTGFAIIYITVKSDVASALDGLSIQESSDGVNWDHTDEFTIPAATGKTFSFQAAAKWFRIVYTNGDTVQGYFRLQTLFKTVYGKPSSHRIQDSISSDDDAELVKAVITGEDENGIFQNVRVNSDGLIEITDFFLEVARGNIPGHSKVSKFGENNSVGSSPETIWDFGGRYPWATWDASGPTTVNVQSTDANDTVAGTGARTVQIEGLDENWVEQIETIIMDGITPVPSVGQWRRLHRMVVLTGGTLDGAIGNITATNGATVVAQIVNGNNQTLMGVYTIPAGKTGYVVYGKASCGKGADAKVKFFARQLGGVFNVQHTANIYQNSYDYPFSAVPSVPEKTDLDTRATSTNPSGFEVTMAFDVILVDN